MSPVILMPDVELITIEFLRASSDINALIAQRVYPAIPAKKPTFPLITLHRVSGVQAVRGWLDAPEIQVDTWTDIVEEGGSKYDARVISATAVAALLTMHGVQGTLGVVSGVDEVLGPFWNPDPKTARPRYTFSVVVHAHPLPG